MARIEYGLNLDAVNPDNAMSIKGISASVAPDLIGRKPSVFSANFIISENVEITEEYLTSISKTITDKPYMVYAAGQNMSSTGNYAWEIPDMPIFVTEDGISADEEIKDSHQLTAIRTEIVAEEILPIQGNSFHKIIMKTASKKFKLTFNPNGGKFPIESKDYYVGEFIIVSETPTKEGYDFVGWQDEETEEMWDFEVDTMPEKNLVLVAVWKLIEDETESTVDPTGTDITSSTIKNNPQTGETSFLAIFGIIALIISLIISLVLYSKKRNLYK